MVLVARFHGWGAYASVVSTSHDPVFRSDLSSASHAAHSSHHDQGPESAGGHDAADHSHDKTRLPRNGGHALLAPADDRSAACQAPPYPGPYFAFDRPPKAPPVH